MTKSNTPCDELYTSKQSELVAISVGRNNNQPLVIAGPLIVVILDGTFEPRTLRQPFLNAVNRV
jgi:hypothetical protein